MSHKAAAQSGSLPRSVQAVTGGLIGVLLFVALASMFLFRDRISGTAPSAPVGMGDGILFIVVGLLIAALVALYSASDVVKPYLQSTRVIAKNAMLWVMFLACMASSVFFSFEQPVQCDFSQG